MKMLSLAKYHRSTSRKAAVVVWGAPVADSSPVPQWKAVWHCRAGGAQGWLRRALRLHKPSLVRNGKSLPCCAGTQERGPYAQKHRNTYVAFPSSATAREREWEFCILCYVNPGAYR